jgi:hypothetical protein
MIIGGVTLEPRKLKHTALYVYSLVYVGFM